MKLLKLKINRAENNGRTHYTYPSCYDAKKVKFGPIYEGALPENILSIRSRDSDYEYIIFGVNDSDADSFTISAVEDGFNFVSEELTEEEMLSYGNIWTKQRDKITDQIKVISILAKVARNDEELTQVEKDSINPDNPEPGINKSKSFQEALDEFLGK